MYTTVTGTITLKEEYLERVVRMVYLFNNGEVHWERWRCVLEDSHDFHSCQRKTTVLWGGHGDYVPPHIIGDELIIQASLKNYCNTLKVFLEEVVPLIGEEWCIKTHYEEDNEAVTHQYPILTRNDLGETI